MNRRMSLVLLAGAAIGFAADPLPSAESVLDRYVQVTGGKQAYEKRKTEIAHGTLEYTALGIKGTITRWAADPDKYYAALEIQGFTDARGSVAINKDLSDRRARAVYEYLAQKHDVPLFRMNLLGYGKDRPVADNKTREGRAQNRRVDVRVMVSPISDVAAGSTT